MTRISVSHYPSGQVVTAQVVCDSAAVPATLGVRSAGLASRHLLFQADGAEVLLQVRPDEESGRLGLMGQVRDAGLPSEAAGVELLGPNGEIARMTDDEGEFRVDALPTGTYSLTVGTIGYLFHVPAIVLG